MAGDARSYQLFLLSVTPHVRAVISYYGRGAAGGETEDIVQEVLLTIHLKRETWDQSRPIGPWIAAITRNKLFDVLRRRGRRVNVPIEDLIDDLRAEVRPPDLDSHCINAMLKRLDERQQQIVQSISLDENSIRETAIRLQMTEGAVRVALHRALKKLAALYRSSRSED
jgi:RNA polymerase sigma factor (sigma-70 family)